MLEYQLGWLELAGKALLRSTIPKPRLDKVGEKNA
jgi:hypothetical protein